MRQIPVADKLFYSYTLPRKFKDMNIPINIQSCFLRDYCDKNNLRYVLPQTEIINDGSIYILRELIIRLAGQENLIGMTSIFMLPHQNPEKIKVIQQLDVENNIEWHFPLETIVCETEHLLDITAEYAKLEFLSGKSGKAIYKEILSETTLDPNISIEEKP